MIPQCPAEPPAKQAGARFPAWRQPRAPAAPHHTSRGRLPPTVWTQTRARVLETCRQEPREGVSCSLGPGPTRGCQAWRVERKSGSSDRAHEVTSSGYSAGLPEEAVSAPCLVLSVSPSRHPQDQAGPRGAGSPRDRLCVWSPAAAGAEEGLLWGAVRFDRSEQDALLHLNFR